MPSMHTDNPVPPAILLNGSPVDASQERSNTNSSPRKPKHVKKQSQAKSSMRMELMENGELHDGMTEQVVTTADLGAHDIDPETEFRIPNDGNLVAFTVENMVQFLKCLRVEDRAIERVIRRKIDGHKFSKMTDSDLDKFEINNPIVVYFRSRTEKRKSNRHVFML